MLCTRWPPLRTPDRRAVYVARKANGRSGSFLFSARWKWTRPTTLQSGLFDRRYSSTEPTKPLISSQKAASTSPNRRSSQAASRYSAPSMGWHREDEFGQRLGRHRHPHLLALLLEIGRAAQRGDEQTPELAEERQARVERRIDLGRAEVEEAMSLAGGERRADPFDHAGIERRLIDLGGAGLEMESPRRRERETKGQRQGRGLGHGGRFYGKIEPAPARCSAVHPPCIRRTSTVHQGRAEKRRGIGARRATRPAPFHSVAFEGETRGRIRRPGGRRTLAPAARRSASPLSARGRRPWADRFPPYRLRPCPPPPRHRADRARRPWPAPVAPSAARPSAPPCGRDARDRR